MGASKSRPELRYPPHLFVELGLNTGGSLLDFASSYSSGDNNGLKRIFEAQLGGRFFDPRSWCYHGFEANPALRNQLRSIETGLREKGLCVTVHTDTIAGTVSREGIPFFVDNRLDKNHGPGKPFE